MVNAHSIDLRNVYQPNLSDIEESARRTYGEANSFFRKEELYLADIERRLSTGELRLKEDIYDEVHAVASGLAECCEMYLKALYIYENKDGNLSIEHIWDELKKTVFKKDENGKLIYRTSNGVITYPKYDANNNVMLDSNGDEIYTDDQNNIYNPNNRGSKIKMNGHDLDRLIKLLSEESQMLLEVRMCTIPMEKTSTKGNKVISIIDILRDKNILSLNNQMTKSNYYSWVESHRKAFEEARYSGQIDSDVNLEFLYHLATQIKAVAQYKMNPTQEQLFSVTDEELKSLPKEIQSLVEFDKKLVSQDLIKLVANNESAKSKLIYLISNNYIKYLNGVKTRNFYNLLDKFQLDELKHVIQLCMILCDYDNNPFYRYCYFKRLSGNTIISLCLDIKSQFGIFNDDIAAVLVNSMIYYTNLNQNNIKEKLLNLSHKIYKNEKDK